MAGFSAVIDRLGEFKETVNEAAKRTEEEQAQDEKLNQIKLEDEKENANNKDPLLTVENLTLITPDNENILIDDLSFSVLNLTLNI